MGISYFPGPTFCWVFLATLWGILFIASYFDIRWLVVPKWLSVTSLALGVAINVVRGGWLGHLGHSTWVLGRNGTVVGICDGLLFSVAGFLTAFALFFLLWILNVCGGGDVKLFASLGAWIGPYLVFWVMLVTVFFVAMMVFARLIWLMISGQGSKLQQTLRRSKKIGVGAKAHMQSKHRTLGFSLPLALACVVVLPWAFRFDLNWAAAPREPRLEAKLTKNL